VAGGDYGEAWYERVAVEQGENKGWVARSIFSSL
jgi:hypothetical protein